MRPAAIRAVGTFAACVALAGCGTTPPGVALVTGSAGSGSGAGGQGGGGTGLMDGVLSTSNDSAFETQPAVAVNSKGEVLIAWLSHPHAGPLVIGYALSKNHGSEWATFGTVASPGELDAGPPSLTVGTDDEFLMTWLASSRSATANEVYIAKTSMTDARFGPGEQVTDPKSPAVYASPSVVVSRKGTTIVAFSKFFKDGPHLEVASKGSQGLGIWTYTAVNMLAALPTLCATRQFNDIVYVTIVNSGIWILASHDEGLTWKSTGLSGQSQGIPYYQVPCVAEGAEVWIAVAATPDVIGPKEQKSSILYMIHSGDALATIDPPFDAKDATIAPYVLTPALALEGSSAVDLAYYSGAGNGDSAASVRWARWPSGKMKFDDSQLVHRPIFFTPDVDGPQWMGYRLGLAWAAGTQYVAYVDNAGPDATAHVALFRSMK